MKAHFQTLLRDVATARRAGSLSGRAVFDSANISSAEPINKVFALLFGGGKLLGCEYAGRSGTAALLQLLDAQTIVKVRWFAMREGALGNTEPLLLPEQLLFLIDGSPADAHPQLEPGIASQGNFSALKRHAVDVFLEFFGDGAKDRVDRIFADLGTTPTSGEVAHACSRALEPLLGQGMAQSYFKKFY